MATSPNEHDRIDFRMVVTGSLAKRLRKYVEEQKAWEGEKGTYARTARLALRRMLDQEDKARGP